MLSQSDIRENSARILVIDAQSAARDALTRSLESAGYQVTALNEAAPAAGPGAADLILIGATSAGWDVLDRYRSIRSLDDARVPVLLVLPEVAADASRAPTDDPDCHVTPPLETAKLLATVNGVLFLHERRRRRDAQRNALLTERLLATLAHELRNPLNAILGWSTLLARTKELPAAALRAVQAIDRGARLQAQAIASVEDYAGIVSGKIRLAITPIDPYTIVSAATAGATVDADAAQVTVHTRLGNEPARVAADPVRLQQIVAQLVADAISGSPKGGRIDVSAEKRGARFDVEVRASGAPDQRSGASLGWAMLERLVSLHGGTLEADRVAGRGAAFKMSLPVL